jgi:hypothetical protein
MFAFLALCAVKLRDIVGLYMCIGLDLIGHMSDLGAGATHEGF